MEQPKTHKDGQSGNGTVKSPQGWPIRKWNSQKPKQEVITVDGEWLTCECL
jgi:hypothetical protein